MSIKKITAIILAILLVAVAVSALVVFLNDSGISDASDENLVNIVKENLISDGNNIAINEVINNTEINDTNVNNVNTDNNSINNINANTINNNVNTNSNYEQGQPEATIIEKEKVVSEKLKLSWVGMSLKGINKDFSNIGIYYTDFEVEKQAKIIPTSGKTTGDPVIANIGDIIEYTL